MDDENLYIVPDSRRISLWRDTRKQIRQTTGVERLRLLKGFADEIRFITTVAEKSSSREWSMEKCLELSDLFSVLASGLLQADPYNAFWPGRDRLVLGISEPMLAVCAALATIGFCSPDIAVQLADASFEDNTTVIPGIDYYGDTEFAPAMAWELAVESKHRKSAWWEAPGISPSRDWANPNWYLSPAMWRTIAIIRSGTEAAEACRKLLSTASELPAGLIVVVVAPNLEAGKISTAWRDSGWDAIAVGSGDRLRLYDALVLETNDTTRAVVVGVGVQLPSSSGHDSVASLLGELSDEQFNTLMGQLL